MFVPPLVAGNIFWWRFRRA